PRRRAPHSVATLASFVQQQVAAVGPGALVVSGAGRGALGVVFDRVGPQFVTRVMQPVVATNLAQTAFFVAIQAGKDAMAILPAQNLLGTLAAAAEPAPVVPVGPAGPGAGPG